MPKLPRPENRDNSLRKLREHLGTNGQPMSQLKLSKALGISKETVFSIENGRLNNGTPTPRVLELVLERFGAVWNAEKQRWESCHPGIPYTARNYELWKHAEYDRVAEADALANGLISLLLRVSGRQFNTLSDTIYRELCRLARVYGVSREIVPNLWYVDQEFDRMGLALVNVWRNGENTKNPEDVIGFKRERGLDSSRGERELLDFRYRNPPADPPPKTKPSSARRSKQAVTSDELPKTSRPQPR